jgi:hypothetical protein
MQGWGNSGATRKRHVLAHARALGEAMYGGSAQNAAFHEPRPSDQVKTDSKGRVKTERQWRLVLANRGTEPARRVRYRLEAENEGDNLPLELEQDPELEVLAPAPEGEASYVLVMHGGVARQGRCVVIWEDSAGEHENRSTLRFL